MRGPCKSCSWLRVARPPSELLAIAIGSNDTAALTALGKIQDDEKELDAQEDMLRARIEQRGQTTWNARPTMSAYCGLEEAANVFHVHEIRNRGMQCEQFATEPQTLHECSTCAHRAVPSRSLDDLKQEQAYAAMSSGKAAMGASVSMIENLWKEHIQSSASRRANEIRDTYQRKGVLPFEPNYLDYCRLLSVEGPFIVCALRNPHGTCPLWSGVASTNEAMLRSRAAPAATAVLDVDALFSLKDEDVEITSQLRATIDDFVDCAGSLLGITFAERQITALRTFTMAALADRGSDAKARVEGAVRSFQPVKSADLRNRRAWRERTQAAFLHQVQQAEDELSKLLREWHAEASRILAAGTPPLTREAAESWVEIIGFAAAASPTGDLDISAPPNLEWDISRLAKEYPNLPLRHQALIALSPIALNELRRAWPGLSLDQRIAAASQVSRNVNFVGNSSAPSRLVSNPPIVPVSSPSPSSNPPGPSPQQRIARSDADPSTLERLTREFATAQARGDHQKAAVLQMQIQTELQNQSALIEMKAAIAKSGHEILMSIWR